MRKNHDAYHVPEKEGYATFTKPGKPWPPFWGHVFDWAVMAIYFALAALVVYGVFYGLFVK